MNSTLAVQYFNVLNILFRTSQALWTLLFQVQLKCKNCRVGQLVEYYDSLQAFEKARKVAKINSFHFFELQLQRIILFNIYGLSGG